MGEQIAPQNAVQSAGPFQAQPAGDPKPAGGAPVEPPTDDKLGEPGLAALQRERDEAKAAKARATAAEARLREIEDAQKSEAQKQTEELDRLRKAVAEHEAQQQRAVWLSEVASATGVPADVLRGSTREEIEAHAAAVKPLITAETGPRVPNPGATPESKPVSDEAAFARSIFGGQ